VPGESAFHLPALPVDSPETALRICLDGKRVSERK